MSEVLQGDSRFFHFPGDAVAWYRRTYMFLCISRRVVASFGGCSLHEMTGTGRGTSSRIKLTKCRKQIILVFVCILDMCAFCRKEKLLIGELRYSCTCFDRGMRSANKFDVGDVSILYIVLHSTDGNDGSYLMVLRVVLIRKMSFRKWYCLFFHWAVFLA